MARLPDVPEDEIPGELAELVAAQRKQYGMVNNSLRQTAYVPPIALAASAMGRSFTRSKQIPAPLASLINLRVAAIVGCPL